MVADGATDGWKSKSSDFFGGKGGDELTALQRISRRGKKELIFVIEEGNILCFFARIQPHQKRAWLD